MAELTGKAISELPEATAVQDADLLALSQDASSKKVSVETLLNHVTIIPKMQYVSDVYWWQNTWTCPESGVAIAEYVVNTSGGTAYWYIQDMTIDAPVGRMNQVANGTSQTVSFPVIKGHVYGTLAQNAVDSAHVYYYVYLPH